VVDGCDPGKLGRWLQWLDESRLGSGEIFDRSVEDLNAQGIGYHGTTALASVAILHSGFQPLSTTIEGERKNLLLRWAEALFPDERDKLLEQFQQMVNVNFFLISELALVHTEQRGGQGICEIIKPFIEKVLRHPNVERNSQDWINLNQLLVEISRNQQSFPVVIAVNLESLKDSITWNPQGAYQVEGTVSSDKIVRLLGAPKFNRFAALDRRSLLRRSQELSEQRGHFANEVRIQTMRRSVGVQPQALL
jgi:hypothetical protein